MLRSVKIECYLILFAFFVQSCGNNKSETRNEVVDSIHSCMNVPASFNSIADTSMIHFGGDSSWNGMVLISGDVFQMGGDCRQPSEDEYPKQTVQLSSCYMDITELTSAQFKQFVNATGYITTAEKNLIGKS